MNEVISVGLLCTALGVSISYFTFRRNSNKDIKEDASKDGEVKTTLAYISKGVDEIRIDIKAQDRKISDISERLIRVEESAKSAHKRLDMLEKEGVK